MGLGSAVITQVSYSKEYKNNILCKAFNLNVLAENKTDFKFFHALKRSYTEGVVSRKFEMRNPKIFHGFFSLNFNHFGGKEAFFRTIKFHLFWVTLKKFTTSIFQKTRSWLGD